MSKQSRVTYRDQPVESASVVTGPFTVLSRTLVVDTDSRLQFVDLTGRVGDLVKDTGLREGLINLFSLHTTCAVFINESQAALQSDIKGFLEKIVDRDAEWLHNDPAHSDCDRFNADSHLRALMLGASVTLQVSGGEIVLGQWQRILVGELDGPRARSIRVMVMGTR